MKQTVKIATAALLLSILSAVCAYGAEPTVNVNTATAEQLAYLPGIGEAKAAAMVEARPFATIDDLLKVKGIGPRTLADLRDWARVDGDTTAREAIKAPQPAVRIFLGDGVEAEILECGIKGAGGSSTCELRITARDGKLAEDDFRIKGGAK